MTGSFRVTLAMLLLAGAVACGKVQARTPAPVVALAIPLPPARVAVPVQLPEPEAPPPQVAAAPPASPARGRGEGPANGGRGGADRPPAPATPPATAGADPAPTAPVLQTTTDTVALEQRTQTLLQAAQHDLDRVKVSTLSAQARAQYDSAMSFVKNAQRALAIKNYMYAEQLAAKAAAVARELVKG